MAQTINTNIASLNAQRNLTSSQTNLATSLQRLSSGLRINSAKDDAAGMAISDRFSTQIRGLNQAARNANDGISLAQTAESAMGEVSANLQRIRELAVQSANATNSASDRAALNAEVQQRISELNRVASQTEFNGTSLLNGTFSAQSFQVGANQGQTVIVDTIASATAAALGLNGGNLNRYQSSGTAVTGALVAGDLTLNGADVGAVAGDAKAIATAINSTDSRFGATATNAQTAVAFTSVTGAGAVPSTITLGAFTTAVASGVAASVTPAVPSTITTGAVTGAVANGSPAVAREVTYGAFTPADSGANIATAASTAALTAFAGVTLGAGQTYSISITTNLGTVNLFTQTNGVVTAADLDTALTSQAANLTAIGVSAGATTVAGNNLVLTNATGQQITTNVLNQSGAGGVTGGPLATGAATTLVSATTANGVLANNGTPFSINIGGLLLYSEAGAVNPATVTAAELDTALTTFTAAHTNYQVVSGSFATGDLRLRDTNGVATSTDITMTQFTGGTNGITLGAFVGGNSGVTNIAGSAAVASTSGTFTLQLDGATIYTEPAATGGTVTAAELDTGLNTYLAGAGSGQYTKSGTFAGGNLVLNKLNGTSSALVISSNFTGGTALAIAGTLTSVGGSPAVVNPGSATTDTAFTVKIDGIQLYTEAAAIGATVTAAELDSSVAAFLTLNTGYTSSGTFAGNNRVFNKLDGTAAALSITSNFTGTPGAFATNVAVSGTPGTVASANYALTLDGTAVSLTTASGDGTITGAEVATAISAVSGFSATFGGGNLSITRNDGSNFTLAESGTLAATQGLAAASTVYRGSVALNSSRELTIGGNLPGSAGLTAGSPAASSLAYSAANVSTAEAANTLLEVVDNALNTVNGSRANLGSIQNRFESIINSLTTTSENLTAARSRILDTDFAAETASLTRNQILQQAGIAMLAQANALPNQVLTLLRG